MSKGITAFVKLLSSSPRGRIVICNIIDGLKVDLIDEDFVRDLMDWWSALFNWRRKTETGFFISDDSIMGTLDLLLSSDQPSGFRTGRSKPNFRLKSKHIARGEHTTRYAHVINASFFYGELLDGDTRKQLARKGKLVLHREPSHHGKIRRTKLLAKQLNSLYRLGRSGEVVFLTPAEGISNIEQKANAANGARDLLGLVHKNHGEDMIALAFECPSLSAGLLVRPTVADAGSHRRFKTVADHQKNQTNKSWGFAADLEQFAAGKPNLDGLRERVVKPISFSELINIELIPLGKTDGSRGMSKNNDDDFEFSKRLMAGRTIDAINAELLSML